MALGWRNALADVLWFRTISYFGAHYRSDHTYPWLASMCDLVTDLDPRAEHVYRFAGVILPWEAEPGRRRHRAAAEGPAAVPRRLDAALPPRLPLLSSSRTTSTPRSRRCAARWRCPARIRRWRGSRRCWRSTSTGPRRRCRSCRSSPTTSTTARCAASSRSTCARRSSRRISSGCRPPSTRTSNARAARRRRRCRRSSTRACSRRSPPIRSRRATRSIPPPAPSAPPAAACPRALHDSRVRDPRAARRVGARAMTTPALLRSADGPSVAEWSPPRPDVAAEPLLELCGLSKDYRHNWTMRRLRVLHGLDLVVRRGEILGLIGPNGAGKTTTFKCLLGLLRPSAGRVLFEGRPLGVARARRDRLPARATVLLRLPHRAGDAVAVRASLRAARPRRCAPASPR